MEGKEISPEMLRAWCDLAASEARQSLLQELLRLEVGLADIEEFGLDLQSKLHSEEFKLKTGEEKSRKLARVTMEIKLRDERKISEDLRKKVSMMRDILEDRHKKNSKPYRATIKKLRNEAAKTRRENKKIYELKLEHLKIKYRQTEDEKIRRIPEGLEEYDCLSVFDPAKFDEIEVQNYEIETIGKVDLNDNEKKVLQLHPKFSVVGSLQEGGLEFDQEIANAKLRIQLSKEDE
jgi:hypothetical protein